MRFVIDTNILIFALIKDSFTRHVLLYSGFDFYYPEVSFREIEKHKNLVLKKSGLGEEKFDCLISVLFKKIKIVPTKFFENELKKASGVMKKIDIDDAVFVALALALEVYIWSDDYHFDLQKTVKNFKTREIAGKFLRGV